MTDQICRFELDQQGTLMTPDVVLERQDGLDRWLAAHGPADGDHVRCNRHDVDACCWM